MIHLLILYETQVSIAFIYFFFLLWQRSLLIRTDTSGYSILSMTLLFWFCDAHGAVCLTKMPPIGIKNFVFLDALEGKYAFICPCSSTFFLLLTLSLFSFLQQDMGIIKRTVHFSKVLMLLARRMTSMTGTWHCLRSVTLTFQYLYQMID